MTRLHVLIAGGGLSGLCLAQGLTAAGISCAVYERDSDMRRRTGYRITINGDGGNALEQCLPADLYELYLQCSRTTPRRRLSVVINEQCEEMSTAPHLGPPNDGPRPHTAIDRLSLRQILAARLDDGLHTGRAATGWERDGDRVRLHLADGSTAEGDVLVGADGVNSVVRAGLMPEVEVIDTGVRGLGIFMRTPLTPEIHDDLPPVLLDGFVIAADRRGVTLVMGCMDPRRPPQEAAAEVTPDVAVDPVPPYMMLSGALLPGTPIPRPGEWTQDTAAEMHAQMMAAVSDWHPALRGLVQRIDRTTMFATHFKRLDPTPPWPSSNVTVIGDAIHAMLPTFGMGGNTSLRDAAILSDRLTAAQRGEVGLTEAVAAYEEAMREYVYPIMEMSADHDRFGGGGLRREEPV
ncbi:MAG TPA: NAD(P)/FAD-dependent oxidoreductase [Solirubrobacteraceae bacterium]|jgi:2-polyprenyl-6-methoxyphenol hydroxylase-like FAD-dependent oxidoreductase